MCLQLVLTIKLLLRRFNLIKTKGKNKSFDVQVVLNHNLSGEKEKIRKLLFLAMLSFSLATIFFYFSNLMVLVCMLYVGAIMLYTSNLILQ